MRTSDGARRQRTQQAGRGVTVAVSAVALLRRTSPAVLNEYRPLMVAGDGNCLYRSVSHRQLPRARAFNNSSGNTVQSAVV